MQALCELCEAKRELGDPCYPEVQRIDDFERALRLGMDRYEAQRRYGL